MLPFQLGDLKFSLRLGNARFVVLIVHAHNWDNICGVSFQ